MNVSDDIASSLATTPFVSIPQLPAAFDQVANEFPKAILWLLLPTTLLYASIYVHVKGWQRTYVFLTVISIACFIAYPYIAPIHCGPFRSLQYFASMMRLMHGSDYTCL